MRTVVKAIVAALAVAPATSFAQTAHPLDGAWQPAIKIASGPCVPSQLAWETLTVANGQVSGTIRASNQLFYLSGSLASDGALNNVRASSGGMNIAFTGKMAERAGEGTWSSSGHFFCTGSWTLAKK